MRVNCILAESVVMYDSYVEVVLRSISDCYWSERN